VLPFDWTVTSEAAGDPFAFDEPPLPASVKISGVVSEPVDPPEDALDDVALNRTLQSGPMV
jgi:hypothetical protein